MISDEQAAVIKQTMMRYGYDVDDFITTVSILLQDEIDGDLLKEIGQAIGIEKTATEYETTPQKLVLHLMLT